MRDGEDAYLYAVPNAGKRAAKVKGRRVNEGAQAAWWFLAEGLRSGVADLVLMLPGGRSVYCETKTDNTLRSRKTYQSEDQREFERVCGRLGHSYRVYRSLEEFADICDEFDVPYTARPITPALFRPRPARRPRGAARPS